MSMIVKAAIGVAAVGVLGFFVLPAESKRSASEAWRRVISDPAQLCLDYRRKTFKDPYSAILESSSMVNTTSESGIVSIKFHAKNSYGAFVPGEYECVVIGGKVDAVVTEAHQTGKQIERLEASTACLDNLMTKKDWSESAKRKCLALSEDD